MKRFFSPSALFSLISALVMSFIIGACVDHDMNDFSTCPTISYENDIHGIVMTKCAISGCHNGDNGASRNWTNFDLFQAKALSGDVKNKVVNHIMPPEGSAGGPLTDEEIEKIACWSDQGAKNN